VEISAGGSDFDINPMKYHLVIPPARPGCANGSPAVRFVLLLTFVLAAARPLAEAAAPLQTLSSSSVAYIVSPATIIPRTTEYTLGGATVGLNGVTKVRVLVPTGYATGSNYPVVYLLHGFTGGEGTWSNMNAANNINDTLEANTRSADIVFVMPDGDNDFYSNWYQNPDGLLHEWETYHIEQLIPWVEANFKVNKTRAGRAVSGVSMGGFGCMTYATRHPDLFAGVFSYSGAVDNIALAPASVLPDELLENFFDLGGLAAINPDNIWGPYGLQEVRWRGRNPVDLADNLRALTVWFRTGHGLPGPGVDDEQADPLEVFIGLLNNRLNNKLNDLDIPHTYIQDPTAGHTGLHFMASFKQALPVMQQTFAANVPVRPNSFNYRSIEPTFNIFDWQFSATRSVIEFLYLFNVSGDGLTLKGSGTVAVTTAPIYTPGSSHWVLAPGQPGIDVWPNHPQADCQGRLHFNVSLGDSHTLQQYTPAQSVVEAASLDYWKEANVQIWNN
jgi:S-formylglutathione hydrolase FrmB